MTDQETRTARALAGIAGHAITVKPTGENAWLVRNGDGGEYIVVRVENALGHSFQPQDTAWACECPDFTHHCRQRGWRCKHIEAVRLTPVTAHTSQGENKQMENQQSQCGWLKLYHLGGVQVTLPVLTGEPVTPEMASLMLASVGAYLAAGFAANLPGVEEGEKVEDIRHVVRRVKTNDDGSETPVIDLYPERANFRILVLYLNTEQDVQAFETACGVRVQDLPLYDGDNSIERGKGPKTDKYVTTLPRNAKAIFKANSKWEGDDDKKHTKRLFIRWHGVSVNGNGSVKPADVGNQPTQPAAKSSPLGTAAPATPANGKTKPLAKDVTAARAMIMTLGSEAVKGKPLGELGMDVWSYLATTTFKSPDALALQDAAKLLLLWHAIN